MKFVILTLLFFSHFAKAEMSVYVGPTFGSTSYSSSDGTTNRDTKNSYGGQAYFLIDHWLGGFNYTSFSPGKEGNSTVNVQQDDQWIEFQARYKILRGDISPYVSLGAGGVIESVRTQFQGETETNQETFFVRDIGAGALARFFNNVGVDVSAKYYQYSNVNGFNFLVSLGYFPIF